MKVFHVLVACLNLLGLAAAIAPEAEAYGSRISARDDPQFGWQNWTAISPGQFNLTPGSYVATFDGNQLFAIRQDGVVCMATVDKNGVWSAWKETATNVQLHGKARIATTLNVYSRMIELYATAIDGNVWGTVQKPDGSWQPWALISTVYQMGDGAPITIFWNHNYTVMELFVASQAGNIVTCHRDYSGGFSYWQPVRPDTQVPPGAAITYRDDFSVADGARELYVVDVNGQARMCPWDTQVGQWKPCVAVHKTPMRPGAVIANQYYPSGDLQVSTNSSGFVYSSEAAGGADWVPVDSGSNIKPGTDITLYVQNKNEFIFGTNQYGRVLFTARTRHDNQPPNAPWYGWSIVYPLNTQIPSGAAINAYPDPNTRHLTIFIVGWDYNVWSNWWN